MEYTVTLRFRFPAWDEKKGIRFNVESDTKADAIKQARRLAEMFGHTPAKGKGRTSFVAHKAEAGA
jgi:hypothetical protein